jgi:hypothetical protein
MAVVCPVAINPVLVRPSEVAVAEQDDLVEETPAGATGEKIVTIIAADAGWRAIYGAQSGSEELSRIVAWALVEDESGSRRVVGMVIDPQNRTNIVTAASSASSQSGPLSRYGYKERS